MKRFALIAAVLMLSACASIDPETFARRCALEGHGPSSPLHDDCKLYYADVYEAARRQRIADAFRELGREQARDDSTQCSVFHNTITCQ